jgi:DNA transformation protein
MPVSDAFLHHTLEQLTGLGRVTWRRMFGGVGLYHGAFFFAVIDDDALFLKVDDNTRPAYEAQGAGPFAPIPGEQPMRGYYEVPADVFDDRAELVEWAERAVIVARAASVGKRRKVRPAKRARMRGKR